MLRKVRKLKRQTNLNNDFLTMVKNDKNGGKKVIQKVFILLTLHCEFCWFYLKPLGLTGMGFFSGWV